MKRKINLLCILFILVVSNLFAEYSPYPVKHFTGKYGYINTKGEMVIEAKYDYANPFSEGLALAELEDKVFCLDETGKVIFSIKCSLQKPYMFTEGLAHIKLNGAPVFIDTQGRVVINADKLKNVSYFETGFSEGFAVFSNGDSYGYINKKGAVVIEPQFRDARPFSDGMARVKYRFGQEFGYIDTTGNSVIKPQFEYTAYDFSEGLAFVYYPGYGYSFIDKEGNIKIKLNEVIKHLNDGYRLSVFEDSEFESFSEGISLILLDVYSGTGLVYGINKEGDLLFKMVPDEPMLSNDGFWYSMIPFKNGKAYLGMEYYGWATIDKEGNFIQPLQKKWFLKSDYQEGIAHASVQLPDETYKDGLVDEDGNLIFDE